MRAVLVAIAIGWCLGCACHEKAKQPTAQPPAVITPWNMWPAVCDANGICVQPV